MKKVLMVLFLSFVLLPVVQAKSFELSIEPEKIEVHSGTFFNLDILAKNLENKEHDLIVSLRGDRPWWWQYGQRTYLLPEAGEVKMTQGFFPVDTEKGDYDFIFEVTSFKFPDLKMSAPFTVTILPDVQILGLVVKREYDVVTATIEVNVVDDMEIDLFAEVLSGGNVLISESFSQKVQKGKHKFEKKFTLLPRPDYAPGSYTLKITFDDQVIETGFTVDPIVMFNVETIITSTPFSEETLKVVKSLSNVRATFEDEEYYPSGDLVTGDFVASDVKINGGEKKISQSFSLNPGETQVVTIARQIWPVYVYLGIVILAIAVSGNMTRGRYTKPKILKHYRRGRGMTSIVLGVKNTFSPAKKVIIRDWVSPLASVVMGEFESLRPVMRRSEAGTELIWSLGDMRPGEERLISYKIKPIIQGNLKMSRATLKYKTRSGENRRVYSNTISIS